MSGITSWAPFLALRKLEDRLKDHRTEALLEGEPPEQSLCVSFEPDNDDESSFYAALAKIVESVAAKGIRRFAGDYGGLSFVRHPGNGQSIRVGMAWDPIQSKQCGWIRVDGSIPDDLNGWNEGR